MEISKLRSDRVQEGKVSENKGTGKSGALKKPDELVDSPVSGGSSSAPSKENISWSADAALINEGVRNAKDAPDVRADRVAQLKAAIRNGSYTVDAHAVADKMIESSISEALSSRKS